VASGNELWIITSKETYQVKAQVKIILILFNLHRNDKDGVIVISDSDEEGDVTIIGRENVDETRSKDFESDSLSDSECELELVKYFAAAKFLELVE